MATATMPLNTATLLMDEPASTALALSWLMKVGWVGSLRSITSMAPAWALTTNRRLLAASKAGISAALTSYRPDW